MKLQNLYQYDSLVLALDNLYEVIDDDCFYINSGCIETHNNIVRTGTTYLFELMPGSSKISLAVVLLVDVYYFDGFVHLHLINVLTGRISEVIHDMRQAEENCIWKLYDLSSMHKLTTIQNTNEQKEDDLLEFEF
jgi:hypothetical protein